MEKFYKTKIEIVVLSDRPLRSDETLEKVVREMTEGDWVGSRTVGPSEVMTKEETIEALEEVGAAINFFGQDIN